MPRFSMEQVTLFGSGLKGPEGVSFDRAGIAYGGGEDGWIRKITPDGQVSEFANTNGRPLGMAFDTQGNMFVCDSGVPGVMKVTPKGEVSLFANQVCGEPLTLPNFPVFGADGILYVSNSSTVKIAEVEEEFKSPKPRGALYGLRPDGSGFIVAKGFYFANGIAIDPEESAIYVLESNRNGVMRVPILGKERYGLPELYCGNFPGPPDGMAFDAAGNLIVTIVFGAGNQIIAIDRKTRALEVLLHDPQKTKMHLPTNCAFGGPGLTDLYIAHLKLDHCCKVAYGAKGHPLYHQR